MPAGGGDRLDRPRQGAGEGPAVQRGRFLDDRHQRNVEGKQTRIVARYSGSAPAYRAWCDEVAAAAVPGARSGLSRWHRRAALPHPGGGAARMALPPAPALPLRRHHRHARPPGGAARAHPRRVRPRGLGRRGGDAGRQVVRQGPALDRRPERAPAAPRAGDRGGGLAGGGCQHRLRALRGRLCRPRRRLRARGAEPAGRRLRPRAAGPRRAGRAAEAARRMLLRRHGGEHRRHGAARGGAGPRRLRFRRDAGGAGAAAAHARAAHGRAGGPDHRRRPGGARG